MFSLPLQAGIYSYGGMGAKNEEFRSSGVILLKKRFSAERVSIEKTCDLYRVFCIPATPGF
jgi:hypothetical protein